MDDLISRQAAIDAILAVTGNSSVRELYEHVQEHGLSDMWSGGVNAAIDIIIALPSAQPNLQSTCNELATDCISRQAAIDTAELMDWYHLYNGEMRLGAPDEDSAWYRHTDVMDMLRQLPSAMTKRNDRIWEALSKVYNMADVPDEAKAIIGDVMLGLEGEAE